MMVSCIADALQAHRYPYLATCMPYTTITLQRMVNLPSLSFQPPVPWTAVRY